MKILKDIQKMPNSHKWGCKIATTNYSDAIKISHALRGIQGKLYRVPADESTDMTDIMLVWDNKPDKETLKAIDNYLDGFFDGLRVFPGQVLIKLPGEQ